MAERTERGVLNRLIETCKDGERGFRYAADHLDNDGLRALFLEAAAQRQRFAEELLPHAQRLGGDTDAGGTFGGTVHRGWMAIKDAFAKYDVKMIVSEAERGETFAASVYHDALDGMLPPTVRDVVEAQYTGIRDVGERIRREAAALDGA
jgi:uncharacterized protein (TIGR02284 family)